MKNKYIVTQLVFDDYIREYVCSDYPPIEFETFEEAKAFVDNEKYEKYEIAYNENDSYEIVYNNINYICKINNIEVSQDYLEKRFRDVTKDMDVDTIANYEEELSVYGYVLINGVEFKIKKIDKRW